MSVSYFALNFGYSYNEILLLLQADQLTEEQIAGEVYTCCVATPT